MAVTNLHRIEDLMDGIFQAERAALVKFANRETELRTQLADLAAAKSENAQQSGRENEPAFIAGADLQWYRWIDQRRELLNRELAQVLAQKMRQQEKLRLAFGRHQAAKSVVEVATKKAAMIANWRANYMS